MLSLAASVFATSVGLAQPPAFDRLSPDFLDVTPPSARVNGSPGNMTIGETSCRTLPIAEVRRRIVDVAVQEWGFFGFTIMDQTRVDPTSAAGGRSWRRRRLSATEAARVAGSIAGYWAVTPQGSWILGAQNERWAGSDGVSARWRYPWSAAFISWVMCEGGLGDATQFQRAVAHHVYIDQAIRARTAPATQSAFAAYDLGQALIVPGDLLCSARRPGYRSIEERRRQLGDGARTHCDIVVKIDPSHNRILAVGGNVRGTVSLKLLPTTRADNGVYSVGGSRRLFAHLKLRAAPIEEDALDRTPTMQALGCGDGPRPPTQLVAADLVSTGAAATRC